MTASHSVGFDTRADDALPPIRVGREMAAMGQEELAEYLRIDPRTLRRYEAGDLPTPDRVMLEVAELPGVPPLLLYRHFRQKYEIPDDILPPVRQVPVAVAVIHLLRELRELETHKVASRLMDMADDGRIDPDEKTDFDFVMKQLDGVRESVEMLRYSER